jgi:hypothetical protein
MSNGRVNVRFLKSIHSTECKGAFGYGRTAGECASLPAAEAIELLEKGIVEVIELEK